MSAYQCIVVNILDCALFFGSLHRVIIMYGYSVWMSEYNLVYNVAVNTVKHYILAAS